MLNAAMLSKWHVHAEGYAKAALKTGKVKITAVWDDDTGSEASPGRGQAWANELGCDFEQDLDKLLQREDVQAVICDAPTSDHKEVLIKAARAGKHIFTEKALAPTVRECEEIVAEIEKAGVIFTISMPQRVHPVIQYAKQQIELGTFGVISSARLRNGHNGVSGDWLPDYWFDGTKTGGGALMDLGCHPMYTAGYLFGKPKRVSSIMNDPFKAASQKLPKLAQTGGFMDENASVTIEFENGVICVGETSFVSYNSPGIVEIYGTEATLIAIDNDVKLYRKNGNAPTPVEPALPEAQPSPLETFIDACINKTGTPGIYDVKAAVELTRLLESAYISEKDNRIVNF